MVEIWYVILTFMLTSYLVLDGRNFGAGALRMCVAKTVAERQQVVDAIGPLWTWHEVWLVATGGVLFVAFPRLLAASFSGYYLALFLVLWSLILRGMALEMGGQIDNPLWRAFWDFFFTVSNILLAILFGTALGNVARGVPLDENREFTLAFFTHFGVRGNVGLLDWYTISLGLFTLLLFCAHGATYLMLKTQDAVHARSELLACRLWCVVYAGLAIISIETWCVRPDLFGQMLHRPLAWLAVGGLLVGSMRLFTGFRKQMESRAFTGSCLLIYGFLGAGAVAIFPEMLHSTLDPAHSITIYNASSSRESLTVALVWWPFALLLTLGYAIFIQRHYRGKVKTTADGPGYG